MLDSHAVFEHAIEDLEWITNKGNDVYARPVLDFRSALRVHADPLDDFSNARFKRLSDAVPQRYGGYWRRFCGDRRPRDSNIRPSCAPKASERGFDFLVAGDSALLRIVDRPQF